MLTLFKYELRKTRMSKLILLGLTAGVEAYFLYGVYTKNPEIATLATLLLCVIAIMGVLCIGIQSIVTLHHDMNTKQSYMLFMTPHSNYAILGAKALECTVSVVLSGLFYFGLGALDITLVFSAFGQIEELLRFANEFMSAMNLHVALDPLSIAAFVAQMGTSWIETVMVAFLADVIATALLKGKKFGGLVTFILFIILTSATSKVVSLIPAVGSDNVTVLLKCAATLAFAAIEYAATATIMEKKLSV